MNSKLPGVGLENNGNALLFNFGERGRQHVHVV